MALIAYDSTMRMAYDGWSRRAWKEEEKKREEAGLSKNRPPTQAQTSRQAPALSMRPYPPIA